MPATGRHSEVRAIRHKLAFLGEHPYRPGERFRLYQSGMPPAWAICEMRVLLPKSMP